jgi:hypothetical protein
LQNAVCTSTRSDQRVAFPAAAPLLCFYSTGPEGLGPYVRAFRNYASSFQLEQHEIGALQLAGHLPLAYAQAWHVRKSAAKGVSQVYVQFKLCVHLHYTYFSSLQQLLVTALPPSLGYRQQDQEPHHR